MYSLRQAAEAAGKGKPAILKAIKSGRISAKKNDRGEWQIDPAELHRVYPPVSGNSSENGLGERQETPKETSVLEREIEILRERMREKDEIIRDLREDRDKWRQQATALLTDQREKAAQEASRGRVSRAWSILRGED